MDHFGTKTSFLGHCNAEIWHKLLLEFTANCTIICTQNGQKISLYLDTKMCGYLSIHSTIFTKQEPFYSQLDNQSYDHTIMELSDDIKIGPESLLIGIYRIARKFGGELNLAVWRYAFKPPN